MHLDYKKYYRRINSRELSLSPSASRRLLCDIDARGWHRWTHATRSRASATVYVRTGQSTASKVRTCDTVSAGAFFPQADVQVPQKDMG